MLHLRKNKERAKAGDSQIQDRVARGIAGFILFLQGRFAAIMGERVNKINSRAKQFCLVLFCLAFGGLSIYAAVEAFYGSGQISATVRHTQLSIPKYYDRISIENKKPEVSKRQIIRINHFKKYMDSLSFSVKGKLVYDSILKERPGLMDSVKAIEELYYSQSK